MLLDDPSTAPVVEWTWLDTLCTAVTTAQSLKNRTLLPPAFLARHFKHAGQYANTHSFFSLNIINPIQAHCIIIQKKLYWYDSGKLFLIESLLIFNHCIRCE